ncbi:MAG: histidine decarboxylase [Verrucomicrobiales bacterium]|nr:histidine decarboxylase [Verrucomicrobiales bacterium]
MHSLNPADTSQNAVDSTGESSRLAPEHRKRLEELYQHLAELRDRSIGYPCNQKFDYSELYPFLDLTINNVGDPFSGSNFRMNTHEIEREVLTEFARWTEIPDDDYWGYVTNGGTEGNMYGLYLAREIHPDGIVYFSEDTHYSVAKILRLQHTRSIMIRSREGGEIDYEDLEESIKIHREVPPIIFVNVGTTMTGAIDDLYKIREILDRLCISRYYLHVDAALSGLILPFINNPPPWNFASGADSISISGHKMLGSPLPCGVALARKTHVERIARLVEYVGALDTTISGSRNAFTPLILWHALKQKGEIGFREIILNSLKVADYAVERLNEIGVEAWRHVNSITVVFPRPSAALLEKWILAPYGEIAHLIAMPNVTRDTIDHFVDDFEKDLITGSKAPKTDETK